MTSSTEFFEESRQQSRIKSRIVAKYFWAWAHVIASAMKGRGNRIAYMDLFAGPGKYNDDTPSTPVIVLQTAIKDPRLREMLVTVFNDKKLEFATSLQKTIDAIPGIETLKYKPLVQNEEVGQKIVESFQKTKLIPTLLFVDPWGYKGLSVTLISSVLQNWGCDCVFFFNYNRINAGLNNEMVREHMNDLFGAKRADAIRKKLTGLQPDERETLIVSELSMALRECGIAYVLPFTFKSEEGTRTTHHLIFASKHFKGYEIMKGIMAKESSEQEQGVALFAYFAASEKHQMLFEFVRPLSDLEEMLLTHFAGRKITVQRIYEQHNVDRPYIKIHYKKALTKLEAENKIKAEPPAAKRSKRLGEVTFGDNVTVTFPVKAKT